MERGCFLHLSKRHSSIVRFPATVLMAASQNGHGEVVEKLMGTGASIDVQDKYGGVYVEAWWS
jgi:hypothetical protein